MERSKEEEQEEEGHAKMFTCFTLQSAGKMNLMTVKLGITVTLYSYIVVIVTLYSTNIFICSVFKTFMETLKVLVRSKNSFNGSF